MWCSLSGRILFHAGDRRANGRACRRQVKLRSILSMVVDMRNAMVDRRHTGRLLTPMLEGVEREERKAGRVLTGGVDTDDTALLLQFVAIGVAAPNLRIVGKHGSPFVECRSGVEYSL